MSTPAHLDEVLSPSTHRSITALLARVEAEEHLAGKPLALARELLVLRARSPQGAVFAGNERLARAIGVTPEYIRVVRRRLERALGMSVYRPGWRDRGGVRHEEQTAACRQTSHTWLVDELETRLHELLGDTVDAEPQGGSPSSERSGYPGSRSAPTSKPVARSHTGRSEYNQQQSRGRIPRTPLPRTKTHTGGSSPDPVPEGTRALIASIAPEHAEVIAMLHAEGVAPKQAARIATSQPQAVIDRGLAALRRAQAQERVRGTPAAYLVGVIAAIASEVEARRGTMQEATSDEVWDWQRACRARDHAHGRVRDGQLGEMSRMRNAARWKELLLELSTMVSEAVWETWCAPLDGAYIGTLDKVDYVKVPTREWKGQLNELRPEIERACAKLGVELNPRFVVEVGPQSGGGAELDPVKRYTLAVLEELGLEHTTAVRALESETLERVWEVIHQARWAWARIASPPGWIRSALQGRWDFHGSASKRKAVVTVAQLHEDLDDEHTAREEVADVASGTNMEPLEASDVYAIPEAEGASDDGRIAAEEVPTWSAAVGHAATPDEMKAPLPPPVASETSTSGDDVVTSSPAVAIGESPAEAREAERPKVRYNARQEALWWEVWQRLRLGLGKAARDLVRIDELEGAYRGSADGRDYLDVSSLRWAILEEVAGELLRAGLQALEGRGTLRPTPMDASPWS